MSHQRWHVLEKVQVEVALVAGFLLAYYVFWPWVRPVGPDPALVFLPADGPAHALGLQRLALLAGAIWLLAALSAVITISARREGALLATLLGAIGLGLHGGAMDNLLWTFQGRLGDLYRPLAMETILLAGVLAGAGAIVELVRTAVRRVRPTWVRPNFAPPPAPQPPAGRAAPQTAAPWAQALVARRLGASLAAFGATLLIAVLLMTVLLFGRDRGQLLFALAASFFLAAAAAHYAFPASVSAACLAAPIVLAIFLYVRTAVVAPDGNVMAWTTLGPWLWAMPVDWLTAACGGAIGGYWLACRLREASHHASQTSAA